MESFRFRMQSEAAIRDRVGLAPGCRTGDVDAVALSYRLGEAGVDSGVRVCGMLIGAVLSEG